MIQSSATLTIDDARNGGSDDGSWATAIAHTPHLAAQQHQQTCAGARPLPAAHEDGAAAIFAAPSDRASA